MGSKKLIANTALLTGSSLLMSCIGMAFQAWLAARIGPAGIGLYQLTISVTNLAATFAISGIRFASTRLISEELGAEHTGGIRDAMRRCLAYAAFFGTAAAVILFALAEPLGFLWIRDGRTVLSLEISAFSMPCVALCSAMSGYFTACGRVWKPTLVHLLEQLAGVLLVALCLRAVPDGDIAQSCAAVTLGRLAADLLSLLLMLLVYRHDRRRYYAAGDVGVRLTSRMLRISMPLAVSAYARSALNTLQHLLVPRGLRAAGYTANGALSGYGTLQGMALPVVFFPSCLLAAAAEMLVPELTEAQVRRDGQGIRQTSFRLLRFSLLYAVCVSAFLFFFAPMLGFAVYKSADAGYYIRVLSLLAPISYVDMMVDGCLKGLGQQVWSMVINILDSLLSLLLVWQFLPRCGLAAYLVIIYLTEFFNLMLSLLRLRRCMRSDLSSLV